MADISLKNFVSWILWIFFAWTRCVAKVCRSHISISATTYTTSITFECLKIGTQSWQARFTFVCIDIDHIQLLRTAFFWPVTQRVVEPPFPNWYSKLTGTIFSPRTALALCQPLPSFCARLYPHSVSGTTFTVSSFTLILCQTLPSFYVRHYLHCANLYPHSVPAFTFILCHTLPSFCVRHYIHCASLYPHSVPHFTLTLCQPLFSFCQPLPSFCASLYPHSVPAFAFILCQTLPPTILRWDVGKNWRKNHRYILNKQLPHHGMRR